MRSSILTTAAVTFLATLSSACAPPVAEPTGEASAAITGPVEAFTVVLEGPPAVAMIPRGVDPRSPQAAAITRARIREIDAEQAAIEPAIQQLGAQVIARLSRLANGLEILADEAAARRIEALPGVLRVERVPVMERMLGSAVPLLGAPKAWAGVPHIQGDGVTIGIIDSGIDYTHADFGGPGTSAAYATNDSKVVEPGTFPTAKVIGGWDFVGDAYNPSAGNSVPKPDADPLDCTTLGGDFISGGHGTHVAGIAAGQGVLQDGSTFAGPYEATFDASAFRVAPGVAPRASLYALRVFGCEGSTTMLNAALDRASDPNNDGSVADRLDIVNLSLGSAYGLGTTTQANMVALLSGVGTLVVAAAGNEGQNYFVTGAPAVYPDALSVAASVDNDLLSFSVTSPPSAVATYATAEAVFTKRLAAVGPLAVELVAVSPALGCSTFTNAAQIAGKIAILDRGSCSFVQKITNAAAAGAVAAVIVDNEDVLLPFAMGGADPGTVPIPGFMVKMADGALLKAALAQGKVTVSLDPANRYTGPGAEALAGLSSRGPSPTDGRFKPEVTAPGSEIASAGVGTGKDPAIKSGTSMASPMVAGAAALVLQAQPGLTPAGLKAVLVNTSVPIRSYANVQYATSAIGGGRIDVSRAVASPITAAADPENGDIGVSFGAVIVDEPTSVKRTFVVENHGAAAATLDATVVPTFARAGVDVSVSPAQVQIAGGASATLELTLNLDPAVLGAPGPDPGVPAVQGMMNPSPRHYLNEATGVVRLSQAGVDVGTLPYNGSVRAAVRRKGVAPSVCGQAALPADGPVSIELDGGGAHPSPVVSAFQLGALDEMKKDADINPSVGLMDLRAVGVATDLATASSFEEAHVFFGVAITGTWTTPARGPVSIVSIEINSDQKGAADYEIRVEARNPDAPFRDSLVASTYDRSTNERFSRFPINVLTPDVAASHPFNNSVLVLSASMAELGIDPANPVFGWAAVTERPDVLVEGERVKGVFDAAHPLVDTAFGMNGSPMFVGDGPVKALISPEARAAGAPVDVLLLHHTNVPGQRWEVVSVPVTRPTANLKLATKAPATVERGATTTMTLVVTNDGADPAPGVKLDADAVGGQIVGAQATQGTCTPGTELACVLGDVAAGASVTVTATVRPIGGNEAMSLQAKVASDLACETVADDNAAAADIAVRDAPAPEVAKLYASGGCACRAGERDAVRGGWLAAALGLVAAVRRRASRRARANTRVASMHTRGAAPRPRSVGSLEKHAV